MHDQEPIRQTGTAPRTLYLHSITMLLFTLWDQAAGLVTVVVLSAPLGGYSRNALCIKWTQFVDLTLQSFLHDVTLGGIL